jgi:hypothetical protein
MLLAMNENQKGNPELDDDVPVTPGFGDREKMGNRNPAPGVGKPDVDVDVEDLPGGKDEDLDDERDEEETEPRIGSEHERITQRNDRI